MRGARKSTSGGVLTVRCSEAIERQRSIWVFFSSLLDLRLCGRNFSLTIPKKTTAATFRITFFLRLLRRHQAQACGGTDFSSVDETSFLERRQMFFDRHEMGGSLTGGRGRIDVIADQNGSSGNQQAIELSIELWDATRVSKLVHGLERDDEIEAGANPRCPIGFFEIRPKENRPILKLCQPTAAKVQHLRREVDQGVARDFAIFQQCFG